MWKSSDAPAEWRNLHPALREKALELAGQLDDGTLERDEVARRAMAAARRAFGLQQEDDLVVRETSHGWSIAEQHAEEEAGPAYSSRQEAVREAVDMARQRGCVVIVRDRDGRELGRQAFRNRVQ